MGSSSALRLSTADIRHREATFAPLHSHAVLSIEAERMQRLWASVLIESYRIAVLEREERSFLLDKNLGRDNLLTICGINPVRFQQRTVPRLHIIFRTIDEIRRRDDNGAALRKRFKIPKNPAIGLLTSSASTLLRERGTDIGPAVFSL